MVLIGRWYTLYYYNGPITQLWVPIIGMSGIHSITGSYVKGMHCLRYFIDIYQSICLLLLFFPHIYTQIHNNNNAVFLL